MNGNQVIEVLTIAYEEYESLCNRLGEKPTFIGFMGALKKYVECKK